MRYDSGALLGWNNMGAMDVEQTLILYHCGVGNTRLIAQAYHRYLVQRTTAEIVSVEDPGAMELVRMSSRVIAVFPVYRGAPAQSMLNFLLRMPAWEEAKLVFAVATCGRRPGGALRLFAQKAAAAGLGYVGGVAHRAPASDMVLKRPKAKKYQTFENRISEKVEEGADQAETLLEGEQIKKISPSLSAPIDALRRLISAAGGKPIRLLSARCTGCGKCIKQCPCHCFRSGADGKPIFDPADCEVCYRCIHRCPKRALSIRRRKIMRVQLDAAFYAEIMRGGGI